MDALLEDLAQCSSLQCLELGLGARQGAAGATSSLTRRGLQALASGPAGGALRRLQLCSPGPELAVADLAPLLGPGLRIEQLSVDDIVLPNAAAIRAAMQGSGSDAASAEVAASMAQALQGLEVQLRAAQVWQYSHNRTLVVHYRALVGGRCELDWSGNVDM